MQAQIAPHFLYNTLDAIVWLAESGSTDEVVHITRALSDFFRISLSPGRDWIDVSEELRHLRGYLTIQKVRYRDILDYEIDVPEEAQEEMCIRDRKPSNTRTSPLSMRMGSDTRRERSGYLSVT